MRIFLPILPPTTTAQQKRGFAIGGRVRFVDTDRIKSARELLMAALAIHKPATPMSGCIKATYVVVFPYTKGDLNTKAKAGRDDLIRSTSKPDLDNWLKIPQDALVKMRILEDDKNVVELTARKFRGAPDTVGIYIELEVVENTVIGFTESNRPARNGMAMFPKEIE